MHIAVLGNAGSWYCRDLERAAHARGHRVSRIDFCSLTGCVAVGNRGVSAGDRDLSSVDVVIVRTMPPGSLEQVVYRMDALARLEASGTVVLNPPKAIECAVDKYLSATKLAAAGLSVPPTVVCERAESAMQAFDRLGGDVVVKPIFGAEGRGIVRVTDHDLAYRTFRTLERIDAVLYLQAYVEHEGFDIRAMVLDGKIIGGMRRLCRNDFRANVAQNGDAESYALSAAEQECAIAAAAAIGGRFVGVDLLYDRRGTRYVIEVNGVPGWRAFARVTGLDVASLVIARLEAGSESVGNSYH